MSENNSFVFNLTSPQLDRIEAMLRELLDKQDAQPKANSLHDLGLRQRTLNMLLSEEIGIEKLRVMTDVDFLKLSNCGRKTLAEIRSVMPSKGSAK